MKRETREAFAHGHVDLQVVADHVVREIVGLGDRRQTARREACDHSGQRTGGVGEVNEQRLTRDQIEIRAIFG